MSLAHAASVSNVKCYARALQRDILNLYRVASRRLPCCDFFCKKLKIYRFGMAHVMCASARERADEKFRTEKYLHFWVVCVCQRILKVDFFFALLSCYNALLSQFYGIDSGVGLGVVLHVYLCF